LGFENFIGVKLGYSNADTYSHTGTYYGGSRGTDTSTTVTDSDGNTVSQTATVYDPDGEYGTSYHIPSIEAGTVLALGDYIIKPQVGFTISFRNSYRHSSYTETTYPVGSTTQSKYEYDYDNKTTSWEPSLGVTVELPETDSGFRQTASLSWAGTFNTYNDWNKQSTQTDTTDNGTYTRTVTTKSGNVYDDDHSYSRNSFVLSYKVEKDLAEGFTVAAQPSLEYYFSSQKYAYKNKETVTTVDDYTTYTETSIADTVKADSRTYESDYMNFAPSLAAAMKYDISSKFRFNAGVNIALPALSVSEYKYDYPENETTTTTSVAADGTVTESTTVTKRDGSNSNSDEKTAEWSALSAGASLGFTWFLSDNFTMDTALQMGIESSSSSSSIFDSSLYLGAMLKY